MKQPHVLVIGSINMDLTSYSQRIPHQGETVLGHGFVMAPGGKGANQALASARLGAHVTLLGAVATDHYGTELISHLEKNNVNISRVKKFPEETTGVALINVDTNGNNQIVVVPGANFKFSPAHIVDEERIFSEADVVVLQLELPLNTVAKAIEIATQYQKPVILNPAPAQKIPESWLHQIDYLIPNEHEISLLDNHATNFYTNLRQKLKHALIVTKGEKGVTYGSKDGIETVPAFSVTVVDTTGAGDAFIGGFSTALAENKPLKEAVIFASAVAAISVTRAGAQNSLPNRNEVDQFIGGHKE